MGIRETGGRYCDQCGNDLDKQTELIITEDMLYPEADDRQEQEAAAEPEAPGAYYRAGLKMGRAANEPEMVADFEAWIAELDRELGIWKADADSYWLCEWVESGLVTL